jgi:hypothetical protein
MPHGKYFPGLAPIAALTLLASAGFLFASDQPSDPDEELLQRCEVSTDGPGLLAFLRRRTLAEEDRRRLERLIQQLASGSFKAREHASRELALIGPPALPLLRRALRDPDREVVRRAERCIAEIERGPGPALPAAALHLLARRSPLGTVQVMLDYAPFVDDDSVEEALLASLGVVAVRQGTVDPLLLQALTDPQAGRRLAAAYVVGRRGTAEQRGLAKRLLRDRDAQVRYRAAQGLIAGRERDGVPTLVALLADAPLPIARQAEELLYQIAGDHSPRESLGIGTDAARQRCRQAWAAWWREQGARVDLARLEDEERQAGLTVVSEPFSNAVWECGPDGKVRWRITGLQSPWDAQSLPGGRVLIAEYQGSRVTERDQEGRLIWEKRVAGTPNCCQRLPNGNTFITTNQVILEVDRNGQVVYSYSPGDNLYIVGAMKERGGRIVCGTSQGVVTYQQGEAGTKWKMTRVGHIQNWCRAEALPGGRVLVAIPSEDKVLELDPTGKVLTSWGVAGAASAVRLPNGHTLVACSRNNRIVELDRDGKTLWEKTGEGQPWRVRRR